MNLSFKKATLIGRAMRHDWVDYVREPVKGTIFDTIKEVHMAILRGEEETGFDAHCAGNWHLIYAGSPEPRVQFLSNRGRYEVQIRESGDTHVLVRSHAYPSWEIFTNNRGEWSLGGTKAGHLVDEQVWRGKEIILGIKDEPMTEEVEKLVKHTQYLMERQEPFVYHRLSTLVETDDGY